MSKEASWKTMQLQDMLKSGSKHMSGLEEAVYRNIDACKKLSEITRTSLGPNGMNKMVINHLDKLFVTSDAATIVKELDVNHPAAKLLVNASLMQEMEMGDGTNFVLVFGGELLQQAHGLLKMGLKPSDVAAGYEMACRKAIEILEGIVVRNSCDFRNPEEVAICIRTAVASKQFGYEDVLSRWIAEACCLIMPTDVKNFSVDSIRVAKIPGGGVLDTQVVKGMVIGRDTEGAIKSLTKAKIAVYADAIDTLKTDTKGTVLINNADQLLNYNKGEEDQMEAIIRGIAESGAKCVVTGGKIGDLALHYLERYGLMSVKVLSKFDLRRLAKAIGATPLMGLGVPTPEEMGMCDSVAVHEIGSTKVTIFRQDDEKSGIATLVVRGSTSNIMDDIERAVDDGVNLVKAMTKDTRFVSGAGATEMEVATQLKAFAEVCPGLEQYAIKKYAEALEVFPRTLAQNAGLDAGDVLADIYAAHAAGKRFAGVDILEGCVLEDASASAILDHFATKVYGLRLASESAATLLRVDEIIMAKPAGGPKPPEGGGRDEAD